MKITEILAEGTESFRNKIRDALWYAYQNDPMMPPAPHEQSPEDMDQDEYEDFEDLVDEILEFAIAKNITNAHLAVAKHSDRPIATGDEHRTIQEDDITETAAWKRKAGKSKTGGLNKKGVASYRREHPGSKLQTAVTTKPSKLKKGSKASKRRKSFCARMGGVKGPMKKPNGKPTRKALALRKWNCESVEQLQNMLMIAESTINNLLIEGNIGSLVPDVARALPATEVLTNLPNTDPYLQYRMGLALAAARAHEAGDISFDETSAFGENMAVTAYSNEDLETLKLALKLMPGLNSSHLISTVKSEEGRHVSKQSPVQARGPITRQTK
jgi:hypothetical protein